MKLKAIDRILPHNIDILSVIYGNLLGDGYAEKRSNSTRLTLHLGHPNREYIAWLKNFYFERGYCSNNKLKFKKQINKNNKIYFSTKINTYSFISFNFIYEQFYKVINNNKIKVIPKNIILTPLTLAIWFMDDGSYQKPGLKISTDSFLKKDLIFLQNLLLKKYNLNTTLQKRKLNWTLYFPKVEAIKFAKIIKPYLHFSMLYKIKNL
jgi:hypothetical protein